METDWRSHCSEKFIKFIDSITPSGEKVLGLVPRATNRPGGLVTHLLLGPLVGLLEKSYVLLITEHSLHVVRTSGLGMTRVSSETLPLESIEDVKVKMKMAGLFYTVTVSLKDGSRYDFDIQEKKKKLEGFKTALQHGA